MLSLLLDEHISYKLVQQIRAKRPEIPVVSIHQWRGGALLSTEDTVVLRAAADERLTLVTYDCQTILPVLVTWGSEGISHAGVIFVDEQTILPNDLGGLIRALTALWDRERDADWTNRPEFLQPPR